MPGGAGSAARIAVPPLAVKGLAVAGLALCLASLVLTWPGLVLYDTLNQYQQALNGAYDDWHPPIMARLWGALLALGVPGSGPMLLLQQGLFWGGLTAVGVALAATGARRRAGAALAVGVLPLVLDWMTVVIKDAELAATLTAATGIVAWHRLRGRPMGPLAVAGTASLLTYAVLVRANAVFAVAPLVCAWGRWAGLRHPAARLALLGALTVGVVAILPLAAHRLFGATATHVERTLPVYDMAGIAHHGGLATIPGLAPPLWREAERRHCYTPFYWDTFGDATRCGFVSQALAFDDGAGEHVQRDWLFLAAHHPIAYALHRLGHWNSNLRFLVPPGERSAEAPMQSEPNDQALGRDVGPVTRGLWWLAHIMALSPFGWPVSWLVAGAGLAWTAAGAPRSGARDLGLSLALSAACLSGSFAVVSIASDLRYHLWSLIAVGLAATLLVGRRDLPPVRLWLTGAALAAVAVAGGLARLLLVPTG